MIGGIYNVESTVNLPPAEATKLFNKVWTVDELSLLHYIFSPAFVLRVINDDGIGTPDYEVVFANSAIRSRFGRARTKKEIRDILANDPPDVVANRNAVRKARRQMPLGCAMRSVSDMQRNYGVLFEKGPQGMGSICTINIQVKPSPEEPPEFMPLIVLEDTCSADIARRAAMVHLSPVMTMLFDSGGLLVVANHKTVSKFMGGIYSDMTRSQLTLLHLFKKGVYKGGEAEMQELYERAVDTIFVQKKDCHRLTIEMRSSKDPAKRRFTMLEMWRLQDPVSTEAMVMVSLFNMTQQKELELELQAHKDFLTRENQVLEFQNIRLEQDKMKVEEENEKMVTEIKLLSEHLEAVIQEKLPVPQIDTETPVDMVLNMLRGMLTGSFPTAPEIVELVNVITHAQDLRAPVQLERQLLKEDNELDTEVGLAMLQLLKGNDRSSVVALASIDRKRCAANSTASAASTVAGASPAEPRAAAPPSPVRLAQPSVFAAAAVGAGRRRSNSILLPSKGCSLPCESWGCEDEGQNKARRRSLDEELGASNCDGTSCEEGDPGFSGRQFPLPDRRMMSAIRDHFALVGSGGSGSCSSSSSMERLEPDGQPSLGNRVSWPRGRKLSNSRMIEDSHSYASIMLSITPANERILQVAVSSWTFSVFMLVDSGITAPLSMLTFFLLKSSGVLEQFPVDEIKLSRFLRLVEEGYPSNPYHNRAHAASVMQLMHMMLHHGGLQACGNFDGLTMLACYLAAAMHDFEHPGVNNDFLIKSHDPLAILYNDQSPLENHHLAASFRLMMRNDYNFLADVPSEDQVRLRSTIIDLVLATDMKRHFNILSRFQEVFCGSKSTAKIPHPAMSAENGRHLTFDEDSKLVLQIGLKCADIGHLSGAAEVHRRWVMLLEEEFFLQGDRERAAGMAISPLMDRGSRAGITKSQVGFFNIVGLPLFQSFADVFKDMKPLLDSVMANCHMWQKVQAQAESDAAGAAVNKK